MQHGEWMIDKSTKNARASTPPSPSKKHTAAQQEGHTRRAAARSCAVGGPNTWPMLGNEEERGPVGGSARAQFLHSVAAVAEENAVEAGWPKAVPGSCSGLGERKKGKKKVNG